MIKNHDMVRSMLEKFPPDENGYALRNMQESGDDLSKSRDIDFSILFQNGGSAKSFCEIAAARGWKVCISAADVGIWDVTVTSNMVPTYSAIGIMEQLLLQLSAPMNGRNDGWGCFAVPLLN
jgi:hypothetical protein